MMDPLLKKKKKSFEKKRKERRMMGPVFQSPYRLLSKKKKKSVETLEFILGKEPDDDRMVNIKYDVKH